LDRRARRGGVRALRKSHALTISCIQVPIEDVCTLNGPGFPLHYLSWRGACTTPDSSCCSARIVTACPGWRPDTRTCHGSPTSDDSGEISRRDSVALVFCRYICSLSAISSRLLSLATTVYTGHTVYYSVSVTIRGIYEGEQRRLRHGGN